MDETAWEPQVALGSKHASNNNVTCRSNNDDEGLFQQCTPYLSLVNKPMLDNQLIVNKSVPVEQAMHIHMHTSCVK